MNGDYMREVVKLRERIETLECENMHLKRTLKPIDNRFRTLKMTPNEGRILHLLYDASPRTVSNQVIRAAVDGGRDLTWPENNLKVYIWKIRQKLKAVGAELYCQHGVGYYITASSRDILARVIQKETDA